MAFGGKGKKETSLSPGRRRDLKYSHSRCTRGPRYDVSLGSRGKRGDHSMTRRGRGREPIVEKKKVTG